MRVVFMGTPEFAVPALEALARTHDVLCVVTRPDRVAGRGSAPRPSPVAQTAERLGLPVIKPETLRGDANRRIAACEPDVICVAAFGLLLPPETLAIPRFGCVNVHASLLPRHRGAAPVQRAILEGDDVTGVSIMLMEEGLDTGPYAMQRAVPIGEAYAAELEMELAALGAQALVETLEQIAAGTVVWTPQDESRATYAPKVTKDDVALTANLDAEDALRRVRASTRRAPARACVGDRELTVVRATALPDDIGPGAVCLDEQGTPVLGFARGALRLDVVRPAGRLDMPGDAWARGARLAPGVCWRCTR